MCIEKLTNFGGIRILRVYETLNKDNTEGSLWISLRKEVIVLVENIKWLFSGPPKALPEWMRTLMVVTDLVGVAAIAVILLAK